MAKRRSRKQPGKPRRPKHSLLCYHPLSDDRASSFSKHIPLKEFLNKYHLTFKNIVHLVQNGRRYLFVKWHRSRYYIGVHSDCLDDFKYYCMYERKNHPAKKGNGRNQFKHYPIIEEINKKLYPFWVS